MYIDMDKVRKAASNPSERNEPFKGAGHPKGEVTAKNDPVGLEPFGARPYARDDYLNTFDRN